jgi:thiol:disulfide interchange protein
MNSVRRLLATLLLATPFLVIAAGPLYPAVDQARKDIDAALKDAAKTKRRVIVDFGGDWCTDCRILDINLKKPENAALLEKNFVMVHVNVGAKGITDNFEVAERYGIPLKKGVPALAVLESDGRVVYAQKAGEFENMRNMDPKSVNDFLTRWKR